MRDRGLLDENSVLLDLSRAAYARLFGGLGGKQWISAYYSDSNGSLPMLTPPVQPATFPPVPAVPAPSPTPRPDKLQW